MILVRYASLFAKSINTNFPIFFPSDTIGIQKRTRERINTHLGKEEKIMEKNLYPEWQVALSKWRMKYGYHKLTDMIDKKFTKYIM